MTAPAPGAGLGLATPANLITLARIGASPVLFWLILRAGDDGGSSWVAVAVALVFAASDAWDGRLARNTGTVTRAGAFLDPLADKVVVLGSMACLATIGRVSWVPVALIAAREASMSAYRVHSARRGVSVPARPSAKWKVIVQGLAVILTLVPPLAAKDSPAREGFILAVWWLAVAATAVTGLLYLLDGRRVAGSRGTAGGGPR
ncbi:MAG: CDP-alcohol phosphatidyltransferase family protein [bacterium]|nr:CDP-alcohol phosphatidyltransferase family protein [bacterium]